MPASVVALLTCKKLIYDIRDPFALCYRFSSLGKKLAYSIDWCVMAMSIKFVLPTDRYIPYLGRWSKGKREVYVIPNTCKDYYSQLGKLDDSVIPPRKDGIVRLAYLGYLDVTRGSQWLLDFCGDTSNNTELIVAGNCRDKELVEKLENTPNVYYTGRLPYADCWSLMRDVDGVTVFYDPAVPVNRVLDPTKFYEAMMVGTPVLISKNMSLNEVVDNNKLGFIIEHNSMDGMSKAVEKLRDISFVKPLRNRCREYYQANLNLDNEMTKYKEFYKRVRSLLRN
jgi:glycosyltransferase involved in cell wall biosynthesis